MSRGCTSRRVSRFFGYPAYTHLSTLRIPQRSRTFAEFPKGPRNLTRNQYCQADFVLRPSSVDPLPPVHLKLMPPVIPKGYVQCFCPDCAGTWQPRSTRNGHYHKIRRPSSSSISKYSLSVKNKKKEKMRREKRPTEQGALKSSQEDAVVMEEAAMMEDEHTLTDASRRGASWAASILSAIDAPRWAFVPAPLSPSPSCPSSNVRPFPNVLVDSLSRSSSPAFGDQLAELNTAGIESDSLDSSLTTQAGCDPEPIYSDDWDDEGENEAPSELPLPSIVSDEPSPGPDLSGALPEDLSAVPAHTGASVVPATIPLKQQALARMDEPDPFQSSPVLRKAAGSTSFNFAPPPIVLAMLLVSWLHLAAHLPFRFCDVILTVIGFILAETGQESLVPYLRSTLTSSLSHLQLEPHIHTYPTCPECLEVYPESITPDMHAHCRVCGHPLFKLEETASRRSRKRRSDRARYRPHLRTPAMSLSEQLAEVLRQPGIEEALSSWRKRTRSPGVLNDFFDGAISRELLGPDGKPFFRHDLDDDPDGELRIGVALGVD
ncbi:hypothetical protein BD414DRAFT_463611, partial [Trametes punicea]